MYKGYRKEKVGGLCKIFSPDGAARLTVTENYLKAKGEKVIIEELIKHRIPQKPHRRLETEIVENRLNVKVLCFCPECRSSLGETDDEWKYHHCVHCGQVIDWSGL